MFKFRETHDPLFFVAPTFRLFPFCAEEWRPSSKLQPVLANWYMTPPPLGADWKWVGGLKGGWVGGWVGQFQPLRPPKPPSPPGSLSISLPRTPPSQQPPGAWQFQAPGSRQGTTNERLGHPEAADAAHRFPHHLWCRAPAEVHVFGNGGKPSTLGSGGAAMLPYWFPTPPQPLLSTPECPSNGLVNALPDHQPPKLPSTVLSCCTTPGLSSPLFKPRPGAVRELLDQQPTLAQNCGFTPPISGDANDADGTEQVRPKTWH